MPGQIYALTQTTDGYLWLGCLSGLYRFDGVSFERYEPLPKNSILSLMALPDGGLLMGYMYGGASLLLNGKITDYGEESGLPQRPVAHFARDHQGAIWAALLYSGLARLEGGHWQVIGSESNFPGRADFLFVDRNGTLWVGDHEALFFL